MRLARSKIRLLTKKVFIEKKTRKGFCWVLTHLTNFLCVGSWHFIATMCWVRAHSGKIVGLRHFFWLGQNVLRPITQVIYDLSLICLILEPKSLVENWKIELLTKNVLHWVSECLKGWGHPCPEGGDTMMWSPQGGDYNVMKASPLGKISSWSGHPGARKSAWRPYPLPRGGWLTKNLKPT